MKTLAQLGDEISQAIMDFENDTGLVLGCFLYTTDEKKQFQVVEFDGEKFNSCENKSVQNLLKGE